MCIIQQCHKSATRSLRDFCSFWKEKALHYWIDYFPFEKNMDRNKNKLRTGPNRSCLSVKRKSFGKPSDGIIKNVQTFLSHSTEKLVRGHFFISGILWYFWCCPFVLWHFWWAIEWGITKKCRKLLVSKKNFMRGLFWCFSKFWVSKNVLNGKLGYHVSRPVFFVS